MWTGSTPRTSPRSAESLAQREVLRRLFRAEVADLDWTYVSPAGEIAPGEVEKSAPKRRRITVAY
ncbi:hypothetical protein [Streptomyces sp. TRM68367]|uniref:hypothetical protein n=1 Tax=Streptomyces sp. TRM68367 TaxID=2758415 RepID=UPI00165B3DFE|nr:hypothetical protein [Streptomyces sp. TRM68367]MBC9724759.1 hypothetical protein [Streptomyces sp. TRM68367]